MNKKILLIATAIACLGLVTLAAFFAQPTAKIQNPSSRLQIVAGESFWGSLVAQLGGPHVKVTTIVSDPNADPHEFESTIQTARQFAKAKYVVLNGSGYDSWGQKLIDANPTPERKELDIAHLLGKNNGDNPHFWYNPAYVNTVVTRMGDDLIALDPDHAPDYQKNLERVRTSLAVYQGHIADIALDFRGVKVAATEDIFEYLARATGLDLISPPDFMEAVAEGSDPPTASVAKMHTLLQNHQVSALVYNKQTATPLTESLKKLATAEHIPVVGITETLQPQGKSFQDWMNGEIVDLQKALEQSNRKGQQ